MTKNLRILPLAGAVALLSGNAMAIEAPKPTDMLTDGWEVHGYARVSWRLSENFVSVNYEYGKDDYNLAATTGKNPNQVEFNISKNTTFRNGVRSDLYVRAEYGNGDPSFYSSSGNEDSNSSLNPGTFDPVDPPTIINNEANLKKLYENLGSINKNDAGFELKEAYLRLGGLSYLPENGDIWAGRRYLNREQGLLSGEFWKQSSGVGFGYEQNGTGIAVVSVDPGAGAQKPDGKTLHSLDLYTYKHKMLGGSFNFDVKVMRVGEKDNYTADEAKEGVGASVTYNRDYYGLDGWSLTALAYGYGLAGNRGVNFGQWSGGVSTVDGKKGNTIFFTSYGVLNINDRWQMASEVTYLHGEKIFGLGGTSDEVIASDGNTIDRLLVALRPFYKVNDNFRWEFTVSYGFEKDYFDTITAPTDDTKKVKIENKTNIYAAEIAAVFTVNSDYFGRPQIKPFFTFMSKDSSNAAIDKIGWGSYANNDKSTYQFGVEGEIWF